MKNEGDIPSTTYFALDEVNNLFLGEVDICHYLIDKLLENCDYIGFRVKSSERKNHIVKNIRFDF